MADDPAVTAASIIAALAGDKWPVFPEKIEMSPATLHAVKEAAMDNAHETMFRSMPPYGVPVFVDASVPNGQGRVTWQDGRVEYIGRASE